MYAADFYIYAVLTIDFASYYTTRYITVRRDFEVKNIITNGLVCLYIYIKLPLIYFIRIVIKSI